MGLMADVMDDSDSISFGVLAYETRGFRYWSNSMTQSFEKSMKEYDKDGMASNETFRVYLVEEVSTEKRSYVAFDRKGQPFMDWNTPYEFDMKMILYRLDLKEDSNIVNMAKRIKEAEKDR